MIRRLSMALAATSLIALAACGGDDSSKPGADAGADTSAAPGVNTDDSMSGDWEMISLDCAAGKTLTPDTVTIGTGSPAFSPWVENDAPETGEGFEAAVGYAIARTMGYADSQVVWVRTTFDEAIAPGDKNFDFNMQQYSITPEREETISFSDSYYASNQAIVALAGSPAEGATSVADLKDVKFGAQAGTTSLTFINDVIKPSNEAFVYDDNAGAKAALEAGQIDAIVVDLPTALYISAVEIEGTSVIGQFPGSAGEASDNYGAVFTKDNPLVDCVDQALALLKTNGRLDKIQQAWLSDNAGVPVISVD
jgi:polar amino acid transport system substrate-binding protein